MLSSEFKRESCIYPQSFCSKDQYRGNLLDYETEWDTLGWALAKLNLCLHGKGGLIQRAVDSWRDINQDQVHQIPKVTKHYPANPSDSQPINYIRQKEHPSIQIASSFDAPPLSAARLRDDVLPSRSPELEVRVPPRDDHTKQIPLYLGRCPTFLKGERLDWTLLNVEGISDQCQLCWRGKEISPKQIAPITVDRNVLIITEGRTGEGNLSATPSFTRAAGESTFRKVWTVTRLEELLVYSKPPSNTCILRANYYRGW